MNDIEIDQTGGAAGSAQVPHPTPGTPPYYPTPPVGVPIISTSI